MVEIGLNKSVKEYHPYEIAKDGDDKYFSLLWEYDKAGRRTVYSDPTYGHSAADTSGWTNHTEPSDETDWVFAEPERYLYGETGGLSAMGRVAGAEVRAGDGEPYFVKQESPHSLRPTMSDYGCEGHPGEPYFVKRDLSGDNGSF